MPAGVERMRIGTVPLLTALGSLIWNSCSCWPAICSATTGTRSSVRGRLPKAGHRRVRARRGVLRRHPPAPGTPGPGRVAPARRRSAPDAARLYGSRVDRKTIAELGRRQDTAHTEGTARMAALQRSRHSCPGCTPPLVDPADGRQAPVSHRGGRGAVSARSPARHAGSRGSAVGSAPSVNRLGYGRAHRRNGAPPHLPHRRPATPAASRSVARRVSPTRRPARAGPLGALTAGRSWSVLVHRRTACGHRSGPLIVSDSWCRWGSARPCSCWTCRAMASVAALDRRLRTRAPGTRPAGAVQRRIAELAASRAERHRGGRRRAPRIERDLHDGRPAEPRRARHADRTGSPGQ